ncbi:MAG: TIGR01777 family protein [Phycisphaerales bacterium]|nr:TIGR01777 family protein [Phycisphaerales bacterium]
MTAEREHAAGFSPLRIAVSGARGLVGRQLTLALRAAGHSVVPIVRAATGVDSAMRNIAMDAQQRIAPASLEGIDAIVHLAGAGIADKRWSAARKQEILESRVRGTRAVADAMAAAQRVCQRPPRVLICASGVGYYGAGTTTVDERSGAGLGFLADVVQQWEDASRSARDAGVRTVHLRFGVILSAEGGALGAMLRPFRCGLGGPLGNGRQGFPWVAMDDAIGSVQFCLAHASIEGAVNVVAPARNTQREFAKALGKALHRPAFAPMPAFLVRLIFGELGQALLLEGQFVAPTVLREHGFVFGQPTLEGALARILKHA